MNGSSNENVFNFYIDKVHISFDPKTNEDEEIKEKEINKDKDIIKVKKNEHVIGKSKIIAILLALFLGRYGLHKFYLGKPGQGFTYLIFSRFQIIFFLSICDAFIYLFMGKNTWLKNYGYKKRSAS